MNSVYLTVLFSNLILQVSVESVKMIDEYKETDWSSYHKAELPATLKDALDEDSEQKFASMQAEWDARLGFNYVY